MDNNLSKAIAVLPDNNPTYSSVDVVTQEQIRQPILNSNNDEVVVVIVTDQNQNSVVSNYDVKKENGKSNSTLNAIKKSDCLVIHGDLIKEKRKWQITDEANSDLFEIGKLDKNGNRTGFSYVYLNGDLVEIHQYVDDQRFGTYTLFSNDIMYEYDETNTLLFEGEYKKTLFGAYMRNGYGKEYKDGYLYFEGQWKNDLPNGEGNLYSELGSVLKQGSWNNGYLNENKKYFFWETQSYLEHGWVYFLLISEFVIGVLLLFSFIISIYFSDWNVFLILLGSAALLIFLTFLQQFSNLFCTLLSLCDVILLLVYFIYNYHYFENLSVVTIVFLACFHVYPIISFFIIAILQHAIPFPSSYTVMNPMIVILLIIILVILLCLLLAGGGGGGSSSNRRDNGNNRSRHR